MFQFVYWLRAIAAIMITNSHYANIWPISALAFGGHFGNCIYFFLSGFCLYNIKEMFPKWYLRRIVRIYPPLWIAATVSLLLGFTSANGIIAYIHCYIYPTWYHFVASIMLLYIPYYIFRWIQKKFPFNTLWLVLAVFVAYICVYVFIFDKSYYHIDDVNEKWCRFMFAESMLLGSYAREKYENFSNKIGPINIIIFVVLSICYFLGKKLLVSVDAASKFQFILPIIVVIYIFNIAIMFIKLEKKGILKKVNKVINGFVKFMADISFEIYLVQFIVIAHFEKLSFPLSFIVTTAVIIAYAYVTHILARLIQKLINKLPMLRPEGKKALE